MISKLISSAKIIHGEVPDSERADLFTWRLFLLLGAILYPLLGKTLAYFNPDVIEPTGQRLAIVSLAALALGLSYLNRKVMQHLQIIIIALGWLATAHHFYVIHINQLTSVARVGGLILTASMGLVFTTRKSLFLYSGFVGTLTGLLLYFAAPADHSNALIYAFGQMTLIFVQGVASVIRISMIDALKTVETKDFSQRWLKNDYISKMASLGRMSSGVAHEINNPLSIIMGISDQIKDMASSEEGVKKEYLVKSMATVERSAQRIAKVVNSMRSFSKDSFQNVHLKVLVKEIVDEAVSLCQARVHRSAVELTVEDFPPNLLVECQRTQISHTLLCLITNSLDAVEKTESPWIKVAIKENQDEVEISVTDSGKGFSKEAQAKLFEPFYTTKEKGKAMGLSLNISKRWVESHEGKLYVDTACPNTRFVLSLPKKNEKKLRLIKAA